MPGRASSCSAVAALRLTGPEDADGDEPAGAPAPPATFDGTTTCSPSASGAARLTPSIAAFALAPPAFATASATREPCGSRYRPGTRTAPATSTTSAGGGAGGAA